MESLILLATSEYHGGSGNDAVLMIDSDITPG